MPTYGAPGVYITENLLQPPPNAPVTSPSVAGFVGEHWRGPTGVAVQCNKWQDFVNYYGGFNPNPLPVLSDPWLAYSVFQFFNNGGQTCWINRVTSSVSPGSAASITLVDNTTTPQNTLKLTAGFLGPINGNSIGTWGNSLYASITPNGSGPLGTFTLTLFYGGTTAPFIVETWQNLNMNPTSARYAPTVLNSTQAGSLWVNATALTDVDVFPANTPAALAPTALAGGTDSADPSTTDYEYAVTYGNLASGGQPNAAALDNVQGMLNINLPGINLAAIIAAAITYAETRPYSFLVIDPPQGESTAAVLAYMQSLQNLHNSTYAALYYPWISALNPASSNLQSTVTMPPGGAVLGQYAAVDTAAGPWYAPAGTNTVMSGVVGLERLLGPNDYNALNLANVNALKQQPNGTVIIWGARTLEAAGANVYVPVRRTLDYIEARLAAALEFAVFQPNDTLLWATITSVCDQFLSQLAAGNAFQGTTQASQYYVICNSTNNTPQSIAQGIVNTAVGVALNFPAEFIQLNISQFQSNGATTVTATV